MTTIKQRQVKEYAYSGPEEMKKMLGAFFTPDEYVKISTEYLRNAIERVPEGYDYIILDRCAGTGNLEKFLTDDELSHCILNTFRKEEATFLEEVYGDRVKHVLNKDALSEEFNTELIKIVKSEKKKADNKLIVIGLENPPYSVPQADTILGGGARKQNVWIKTKMKEEDGVKGACTNDLVNQFIWSMTRIYANEYIIYSPIKYWKSQHLFDGQYHEGYLCNRKKFHATEAAISLISWSINKTYSNEWINVGSDLGDRVVKKIKVGISNLTPVKDNNKVCASLYHVSGLPDFKNGTLINIKFNKHLKENKLTENTILLALPLWVANCYKCKDYTEKEVIMKSGDGGIKYQEDKDFLNDCFIWSCLSQQKKCISNDEVKNELCLCQNTKADKFLKPEKRHEKLMNKWNTILKIVKTTDEYNESYTYGFHQIIKEINIRVEIRRTKNNKPVMEYKYKELNVLIKEQRQELQKFYDEYLTPKLFEYELLK